jgi:hypothetical protein
MRSKWIGRMIVTLFVLPFTYFVVPNIWWYVPRLLLAKEHSVFGTYEGFVGPDGVDGSPSERLRVRMTVRPTTYVDTGNTYGYTWRDFTRDYLTKPDGLGGSLEVHQANGRVDRFEVHGHEQEEGETGPTFYIDGGEAGTGIGAAMKPDGIQLAGVRPVPRTNDDFYAGTLAKQ